MYKGTIVSISGKCNFFVVKFEWYVQPLIHISCSPFNKLSH